MISEQVSQRCNQCGSTKIVKNGKSASGKQKYRCNDCRSYGTVNPQVQYTPERKAEILRAYQERSSLRGLERTFGVTRQTVASWLRQAATALPANLPTAEAQAADVLEVDELWSFVGSKKTNAGCG